MQQEHCQNRTDCVVNWNCKRIRVFRDVTLSLGEWFQKFRRILAEEGNKALWNIGNCPSTNTAPYPSKPECPAALLWSRMVLWSHMRREVVMFSKYILCFMELRKSQRNKPHPHWTTIPTGPGPPHNRGISITLSHTTLGRTTLDEWSARRRDFYLATQISHNRHSCPPREDSIPQSQQASSRRLTS